MFAELLETLFDDSKDVRDLWPTLEGPRIETRVDQTLFDVDDPITEAFLILEGRVILFSGEGAPRPLLRIAGPALCGDVELTLGHTHHSHSARCLDRCRVVILSAADLDGLARSAAAVAWYRDIASRYHRTMATAVYEGLAIEERLSHWLADTFGAEPFTMAGDKEIGRHLCVSPDRIGRARRALEKNGSLVLTGERARLVLETQPSPMIHSIR